MLGGAARQQHVAPSASSDNASQHPSEGVTEKSGVGRATGIMADLTTAFFGGVIGALLGLGVKWVDEWRDRRRRRRALATALLVELRSLDIAFSRIANAGDLPALGPEIIAHFFDRARMGSLEDLMLFRPQAVYEVMKFGGFVKRAQERLIKAQEQGWDEESQTRLRDRSLVAQYRVPLVKSALLVEGSKEPSDSYPELQRDSPPRTYG